MGRGRLARQVVDGDLVPRLDQMQRRWASYVAEPDEAYLHVILLRSPVAQEAQTTCTLVPCL